MGLQERNHSIQQIEPVPRNAGRSTQYCVTIYHTLLCKLIVQLFLG